VHRVEVSQPFIGNHADLMNTRIKRGRQRCRPLGERLPAIDESTLLLLLTIDKPADIEIRSILIPDGHLERHLGTFSRRRIDVEIARCFQEDGRGLRQRQIIHVNSARLRARSIVADHGVNAACGLRNSERAGRIAGGWSQLGPLLPPLKRQRKDVGSARQPGCRPSAQWGIG
jgi:hypothetical protein